MPTAVCILSLILKSFCLSEVKCHKIGIYREVRDSGYMEIKLADINVSNSILSEVVK